MMDRCPREDGFDKPDVPADDFERSHADGQAEARKPEPPTSDPTDRSADAPKPDRDVIEVAPQKTGDPKKKQGAEDADAPRPPPKSVFVVAVLLILALVAWGGYEHWRSYESSNETAQQAINEAPEVRTVAAKRLDQPVDLTLPGETQALDTANIYPRATGYIDQRRVDIGSRVKQGDLMVHIAAPDLDQQLAQAEAQLGQTQAALLQANAQVAQAEANVNLAQVNLARTSTLTQQGYETQQNRDTQQANAQTQQANVSSAKAGVGVALANIKAQQAAIDRLKALAAFEDVRAPFDGVVTARNVDIGELMSADQSTGTPMFTVVRDSIMRVFVNVPQNVSAGIRDGLEAKVVVSQMPGKIYTGTVTRTSAAVLYSSRVLTTEIDIPNPTGELRAGLYVTASFAVPRTSVQVNVPAEALMFDQHGTRVAIVDNGAAKLVPVDIARDEGTTLDLRQGLQGGERLILNPPATLKTGIQVKEIREEDQKKQDAQPQASPSDGAKKQPNNNQNGGAG